MVNWLDGLFAIILIWVVLTSWEHGLIQEMFTLLAIGAGLVLAGQFHRPLARLLFGATRPEVANAVAFLGILLTIWFFGSFIGRMIREAVYFAMLAWLDQLGGLVLGVVKGFAIIQVFIILFTRFTVFGLDAAIQSSYIASQISRYAPMFMNLLPDRIHRLLRLF